MYRFVLKKSYKQYGGLRNKNWKKQNNLHTERPPYRIEVTQQQLHFQEAGFGKFLVIVAPFAIGGGIIAYAKNDEHFRNALVKTVPSAEHILKYALGESKLFEDVSNKFGEYQKTIANLFKFGGDNKTESDEKTDLTQFTPKTVKESKGTGTLQKSDPVNILITQTSANASPTKEKMFIIPANIAELEKQVNVAATLAVNEFNNAIKMLNSYNEEIRNIVDDSVEEIDSSAWNKLRNKTSAKETSLELAESSANKAKSTLVKLQTSLNGLAKDMEPEAVNKIRERIQHLRQHIDTSRDKLYEAKQSALLSEKYWRKVEVARNNFINEIEALVPGVNLSDKQLKISPEDLDLLFLHAYNRVALYQKELQKIQIDGETRLRRALDALRGDNQAEALQAQLEYELEKERKTLHLKMQTDIFKAKAEAKRDLKNQVKRLAQAHNEHIDETVKLRESELNRQFEKILHEQLSNERLEYQIKLNNMVGRVQGMDAAVKARADAEKMAHQAQALWTACQALWSSVKCGEAEKYTLRPLNYELKAIVKAAAAGDELVQIVIKTLSEKVANRGVFNEEVLRDRFHNVEKAARRLALVPAEGARLPIYILSYVQSVLVMRPSNVISKEELADHSVDFTKFDTYDILNRARYFVERGNLYAALKYVNLLKGAPRKIAGEWLNEVRIYLETQQAANTLMAHAAASGFQYL